MALEVSRSEKIIDVKRKIEEKIGSAINDQTLVYQQSILENDQTVDECHLCDGSVINVVVD